MSAAFHTLRLARTLRDKARFSAEQAEGMADAIAEALQGDVATEADVRATRDELKADLLKRVVGTIGLQTVVLLGAALALARVPTPGARPAQKPATGWGA